MRATLPNLCSLLLRSSLAAATAAVFYYILGSAMTGRISVTADLPLWLLAMALSVLPVALGSATLARLSLHGPVRNSAIILLIAAPMACAASIYAFRWYMSELVPAVNWQTSWPLPAAASVAAVALEALALWRMAGANRTVTA